mgnify:CR=1 FL=1
MADLVVETVFPNISNTHACAAVNPVCTSVVHGVDMKHDKLEIHSMTLESLLEDSTFAVPQKPIEKVYLDTDDFWHDMQKQADLLEGKSDNENHEVVAALAARLSNQKEILEAIKKLPRIAPEPHRDKNGLVALGLWPALVTNVIQPKEPLSRC